MKIRSENARQKAMRVFPVLVYYAQVHRTLTYGDLGRITGDHHRSFRAAFGVIHDWIEDFAEKEETEALPIAIIVVQQGKSIPGPGAIRWRLRVHGLPNDVSQPVVEALFKEERHKIFEYSQWKSILQAHNLQPYIPQKRPIDEVTKKLIEQQHGGAPESLAHRRLKLFISKNPKEAGLDSSCKLEGVEYVFPSLDRVDVMFSHLGNLYSVEVKSEDVNEDELVKGLYQAVKYRALGKALQKDRNCPPLAHSCLVTSATLTEELWERARLLQVPVIDGVRVPKSFRI
jgi:hypothetical protein